jgi:hemerythrin
MSCFEWDPSLETGNTDIDDQHRGIFLLANTLHDLVVSNRVDMDAATNAIYCLTDYVTQHFADEEDLMASWGFPELGLHRVSHERLTMHTVKLTARFMDGEALQAAELAEFVATWLREHIRKEDMAFVAFLRNANAVT